MDKSGRIRHADGSDRSCQKLSQLFIHYLRIQGLRPGTTRGFGSALDLFLDALYSFTQAVAENRTEKGEAASLAWRIRSYIIRNLNQPLSIERISAAMCLSPSRCSHLFKEQTGMTVRQYIEQEKIRAAKNALVHFDLEISGISEYLAFSSPSHFSSVFKKSTGLTPKEWRGRYRGRSRENAFFQA